MAPWGSVRVPEESPGVAGGKIQPNCSADRSALEMSWDDCQGCCSCGVGLTCGHAVSTWQALGSGRWRLLLRFTLLGFGLLWSGSNWVLVRPSGSQKVCILFLIMRNPNVETLES